MTANELRIIEYWKKIFDMLEQSGDFPREWCRKNGIEYEEFRQYACIFERQKYSSYIINTETAVTGETASKFEIKPIEGTPLVEVPFITEQKNFRDIVSNPWFGHTPSLVISSNGIHLSFYGDYTEERIRTALRGVLINA